MLIIKCDIDLTKNKIVAKSNYGDIRYILPNQDIPALKLYDFAMWGFLPIAMRLGLNIHIQGSLSIQSIESAQLVSKVWASWLPNLYQAVQITAESIIHQPQSEQSQQNLTFFSGGIDSTFSSYSHFLKHGKDSDCLTVHGMDYKFDDHAKFEALLDQTAAFRKEVFNTSHIIQTDAYNLYSKYGCNPKGSHVTHIFSLFSCATLFDKYQHYRIAADYRLDQQFFVHPYGSNTATNRLMKNHNADLTTLDDHVTRAQKTAFLNQSQLDLSTLSICVEYSARPKNCGKCSKCMRTKAMFYAIDSKIPEIFVDTQFNQDWFQAIPFHSKLNRAFIFDILATVESASKQDEFPGYSKLKNKVTAASKRAEVNPFYGMKFKDIIRNILKILFSPNRG